MPADYQHCALTRGLFGTVATELLEWNRIRGMRATVLDDAAWASVLFGFFHPTRLQHEVVPDWWTAWTQTVPDAPPVRVVRNEEVTRDADAVVDSASSS